MNELEFCVIITRKGMFFCKIRPYPYDSTISTPFYFMYKEEDEHPLGRVIANYNPFKKIIKIQTNKNVYL